MRLRKLDRKMDHQSAVSQRSVKKFYSRSSFPGHQMVETAWRWDPFASEDVNETVKQACGCSGRRQSSGSR